MCASHPADDAEPALPGPRVSVCLINGAVADTVSVTDRGLQYGDGVFETLAVFDGRPRLCDRHLERLLRGCRTLGIEAPDPAILLEEMAQIAGAGRCVVKIIVTRGGVGRGYRPQPGAPCTRIVRRFDWPVTVAAGHEDGITVSCCRTRLALQQTLSGCKHLNRLEHVLARAE